ncbi:TIGR02265 family protein [Melittangium boletus]|uniref:TIGR02265 family protein n=1 Tax=Melittangium boletus TaxID=83453 RepID=UPI003DA57199
MMGTSMEQYAEPSFNAAQELQRRQALVGPRDTTRGFLFLTALDVVKTQLGKHAHERCLRAVNNTAFTAFFSYPVSSLLALSYAAAQELSLEQGGFTQALQHLGFRVAPRFLESTTGKMLMSLVGRDPRRLLESLPTAYKTAWDHGGCALKWLGPKSGRLTYTNALPAPYFAGSVQQILFSARLRGQVLSRQVTLTESTVDFAWE